MNTDAIAPPPVCQRCGAVGDVVTMRTEFALCCMVAAWNERYPNSAHFRPLPWSRGCWRPTGALQ